MNELDEQGLSITDKIIRPAEGEKVKLEHCPFCQGTEYYTKVFMKGPVKYTRKFSNDSEDGVDNRTDEELQPITNPFGEQLNQEKQMIASSIEEVNNKYENDLSELVKKLKLTIVDLYQNAEKIEGNSKMKEFLIQTIKTLEDGVRVLFP